MSYCYHDTDLVELAAFVWTGAFAGSTRLYISHGDLADAADMLAGFPMDLKDAREVTIGVFGSESGGGAIALSLGCVDGAGHCKLQLRLESDPLISGLPLERVELCAAVEPAALDRFVEEMRMLNLLLKGSAVLQLV